MPQNEVGAAPFSPETYMAYRPPPTRRAPSPNHTPPPPPPPKKLNGDLPQLRPANPGAQNRASAFNPQLSGNRFPSRSNDETSSTATLSMNGIEARLPMETGSNEDIDSNVSDDRTVVSNSDRSGDVKETYGKALEIIQSIKEKALWVEDADQVVKRLEMAADRNFKRTYIRGAPARDLYENAPVIKVGILFLPGVDRPTVTKLEQDMLIADNEPDQQSASWRVQTAGHLLMDFEVTKDLRVVSSDSTSDVLRTAKERKERQSSQLIPGSTTEAIIIREQKHPAVNIDSQQVVLVNDLRAHRGEFDLESTLIEVDSSSIMNLIVRFQLIIQHKNPSQDLDETKNLLEVMMEDVRRLCHRSAILFRMSTRVKIITSKNTRYGVNDGRKFTTLTTSKGIREIIKLSSSYYSALDSAEKAQQLLRPRFLQMLVLLLSFLNDDDLNHIRNFLEKTFHFKADRPNLELLFLKVIPFYSINSHVFLTSMVPAFEGWSPKDPIGQDYSHYWDTFMTRILPYDYILPGNIDQLGRKQKSWIVEWPEQGFKSSLVFRNLQYGANDNMRTFNDIPPIEDQVDRRDENTMLTVVLTNDKHFLIRIADYEAITCLTRGIYPIQEADLNGHRYDLTIEESVLNEAAYAAVDHINPVIRQVNQWLTGFKRRSQSIVGRANTLKHKLSSLSVPGIRRPDIAMFEECRVSGKLTRHRAVLGNVVLAIAYKIDGRRITLNDTLGILASDNQKIQVIVDYYQHRLPSYTGSIDPETIRRTTNLLMEVTSKIREAEGMRHYIQDDPAISDEPIVTLIQPPGGSFFAPPVWNKYKVWTIGGHQLQIEAKKSYVSSVRWDNEIEVMLQADMNRYILAPLEYVEEDEREEQIKQGDVAVLAGQYMIVGYPEEEDGSDGLCMTAYMKIIRVEKVETRSKRAARRDGQLKSMSTCLFV